MLIENDPKSPLSPREQIADRVKLGVAGGRLEEGMPLPSIRQLALELQVNRHTVAQAYRDLELESIVVTRPGDGVFVGNNARGRCREFRDRALDERLRRLVNEAMLGGLWPAEFLERVEQALRANSIGGRLAARERRMAEERRVALEECRAEEEREAAEVEEVEAAEEREAEADMRAEEARRSAPP